jgi:hypothetical protein
MSVLDALKEVSLNVAAPSASIGSEDSMTQLTLFDQGIGEGQAETSMSQGVVQLVRATVQLAQANERLTMQLLEVQESLALVRKDRNEFQEENTRLLKNIATLEEAKITDASTIQGTSELREEYSNLVKEVASLKAVKKAEVSTFRMRMSMRPNTRCVIGAHASFWYRLTHRLCHCQRTRHPMLTLNSLAWKCQR